MTSRAMSIDATDVAMVYRSGGAPIDALRSVDLQVKPGEFVSVIGPSGCGKSTLLKIIAGLVEPSGGTVRVGDRAVDSPVTDLGIVFQDAVLLEWRRAMANVMIQIEMRGLPKSDYADRASELLDLVGLDGFKDRYPYELSGGMQQRVAICRALVHDPPLLLMDEPFGALDALTRDQIGADLQRIWLDTQKTVVFVTHSVPEAVFLSDTIVVMSSRPGTILGVLPVELERPRSLSIRASAEFGKVTNDVYQLLAGSGAAEEQGGGGRLAS